MACKACGPCWGSLLPPALCLRNAERPYKPAKVVRVHREVDDGMMDRPVFGETSGLADLAAVTMATGAVVALDPCGVQRRAHG